MKPTYATLKRNHYSSLASNTSFKDQHALYKEIGIDFDKLLKENYDYMNTCATRMSLALLKSGVSFSGRMKIKSGKFVGKKVEPGAKLLADQLMMPTILGKPEIFPGREAATKIGSRKGVIFFWKINGYGGGHIDLIESVSAGQVCNSSCYFDTKEVWFWELP